MYTVAHECVARVSGQCGESRFGGAVRRYKRLFNTVNEPLRLIALRLLYLKYKRVFAPQRELISKFFAVPFDKLCIDKSFLLLKPSMNAAACGQFASS